MILKTFAHFITESEPPEEGLYTKAGKDSIKGVGYKDAKTAKTTVEKLDKLKTKDFKWAMSIATTMENRANSHPSKNSDMKAAAKIFRTRIDANKKTD